jgi:hypothetical protein
MAKQNEHFTGAGYRFFNKKRQQMGLGKGRPWYELATLQELLEFEKKTLSEELPSPQHNNNIYILHTYIHPRIIELQNGSHQMALC